MILKNLWIYYLLFRHKSSPSSSRKDPVQEEMEQSDETSIQASSGDCVGSNKPVISSPVSHLWNSEDGVTPLVRPEDAKSTGIYVVVQIYPWFKFSCLLFLGMVIYGNNMIMSLKQKTRKFEPRIKLNHNIYVLSLHFFKEASYSALRPPVWDVAKEN